MKRRAFLQSGLAAAAGLVLPLPRPLSARSPSAPRGAYRAAPDVVAVTGDGREVTLSGRSLDDLAGRLRGRVLLDGEDGYDDARRILNPSFDKRPAVIVQVSGVADVRTAVDFARDHGGLLLAVKCGGHSFSGKSTCDRGMMIDLSRFRDVHVDPAARRARVTGGSLLGAVDHEAMAYGLVVPLGTVSHTGVGGLVTGGGFGRLARRFGLSVDNLLSVDVVTADGQLRRASPEENPDLFWGVRGGGGNFGVVTSFDFRLHPMQRRVVGGSIGFPFARAREVLELYGEYAPRAPEELQLDCGLFLPPGGAPGTAGFSVCWSGPEGEAERALAPLRRLGTPVVDGVRALDYPALQRSGDIDDPRAEAMYLKSGFITHFTPDRVRTLLESFRGHPTRTTRLAFQQCGGAIQRVAPEATAFWQRDAMANMLAIIGWRPDEDPAEHIRWIQEFWAGVEGYTRGAYMNDLGVSLTGAEDAYGRNLDRLVQVKNTYDPKNLFRLNANVQPTV